MSISCFPSLVWDSLYPLTSREVVINAVVTALGYIVVLG